MNLEQKIEHVLQRVKDGYFEQSMPPEETDIDMVLMDCLKEIKRLNGMVESDDYVLVPKEPTDKISETMCEVIWQVHGFQVSDYFNRTVYESMIKEMIKETKE